MSSSNVYYLLFLGLSSVTLSKVGNIGKIIRNLYTNRIQNQQYLCSVIKIIGINVKKTN